MAALRARRARRRGGLPHARRRARGARGRARGGALGRLGIGGAAAMTVELSVILATDRLETIRRVLERLSEQTARERLELVVVTPTAFDLPENGFGGMRLVETDAEPIDVAQLRAEGVRA